MPEQPLSSTICFNCTHCGKSVEVSAQQAGREVGCPHCRAALLVPEPSGETAAPVVRVATVYGTGAATVQAAPATVPPPETQPVVVEARNEAVPPPPAALTPQTMVEAPALRMPRTVQLNPEEAAGLRVPRRRSYAGPPAKKGGAKWAVLPVALLVVVGIGVAVGISVKRNMDRAEKARVLWAETQQTQAAFLEGELVKAGTLAATVTRRRNELKTLGGELLPAQEKQVGDVLKQVADYQERMKEIQGLEGRLEGHLDEVRQQLRDRRALYTGKGAQARPLVLLIEQLISRAEDLARQRKREDFQKQVASVEALWNKGETQAAREQASGLRTKVASDQELREEPIQKRLDRLQKLDEVLTGARWARASVNEDFAGTREKLNEVAATLSADHVADKVILDEIAKLLKDLDREEKTRLKLTEAQLKSLQREAENLAKREVLLQVDQASTTQGVLLRFDNQNLRLIGSEKDQGKERLVFNVGGCRLRFPIPSEPGAKARLQPATPLRIMQALSKGLREAGADAGLYWDVQPDAPAPLAWANDGGKVQVFYDGRLFPSEVLDSAVSEKQIRGELEASAEALAKKIEADSTISKEVQTTLTVLVRGAIKELDFFNFLPGEFCRRVLADGYVEMNVAKAVEHYASELKRYHQAYVSFVKPSLQFRGRRPDGSEISRAMNLDGHALLRYYDAAKDRSYFGIKNPVDDRTMLFVVYEFSGKHDAMPKDLQPVAVRMMHPAVGVMATWDPASGRLDADAMRWAEGAAATTYQGLPTYFGTPDWAFPPHVPLLDERANVKGLVTSTGRVDLPDFSGYADEPARRKAQEEYIGQLAQVLNSTGHLHLYFLYFHQYVLDSPVETQTTLLGSKAHAGDIHQNAFQSLDRKLGGRYLGDCDDLAELYMSVTRRQGKLSYVMSLPGHAACGWVEKDGPTYRIQFLDTGPPRIVEGLDLEKVVEEGSRTYDDEKTMRFDPKSVPFLFRFAGEPTRTPYWLSCRMFYDRDYAEIMERVQGYWHFHFYALGIRVMEDLIGKGDRVPENCVELAGLYGRVREFKKSIEWTREALKQLGKDDVLSRLSEISRLGLMYREAQDLDGAFTVIEPALKELLELSFPKEQQWPRYINSRMEYSSLLVSIQKPWHAWELFKTDLLGLWNAQQTIFSDMGVLAANMLYEMKKQEQAGRRISTEERDAMNQIDKVLDAFFTEMCFMKKDDFNDIQRNYAYLGRFYGGRLGARTLIEELLKKGPFPDQQRNHQDRKTPDMEADWNWIRLSLLSYAMAIGDAIDPDDPPEKWRKDEAVKLAEAMERAAVHARTFGSLASGEHMLISTKVQHAFMTKNFNEFEEVMKDVKARDFARLTASVAETFGRSARFVTPDEFVEQYKVFARYVTTKAPYFNVVYEAYRNESYEHARRAARLAAEHWPDDENMNREVKFLDELMARRTHEAPRKPAEKAK